MGFFNKLKRVVSEATQHGGGGAQIHEVAPPMSAPPPPPVASGPQFYWEGDSYPIPQGWHGLTIDAWFEKFETLRERMRNIDNEQLPPVDDPDLDREEILLITQYGFTGGGHYEKYRNWAVTQWAAQTGTSMTDCEFKYGAIARERLRAGRAVQMMAPGGPLADVEGVSCSAWAQLQAQIVGGADYRAVIDQAGIDQARWQRVSSEWNQRMKQDRSGTVASTYANAFAGAAVGAYGAHAAQAASAGPAGAVGPEPVPFELFVEVTEALRAAGKHGQDPTAVLASFNLRPIDWSNIGMYWNRRMAGEAERFHRQFQQLSPRYAAKYGNGDGLTSEEREQRILSKVIHMAATGQAGQIVPFLCSYFPDDASNPDAIDWWIDKACDMAASANDRPLAYQLMWVRYPLQRPNPGVSIEEWVNDELSMRSL